MAQNLRGRVKSAKYWWLIHEHNKNTFCWTLVLEILHASHKQHSTRENIGTEKEKKNMLHRLFSQLKSCRLDLLFRSMFAKLAAFSFQMHQQAKWSSWILLTHDCDELSMWKMFKDFLHHCVKVVCARGFPFYVTCDCTDCMDPHCPILICWYTWAKKKEENSDHKFLQIM